MHLAKQQKMAQVLGPCHRAGPYTVDSYQEELYVIIWEKNGFIGLYEPIGVCSSGVEREIPGRLQMELIYIINKEAEFLKWKRLKEIKGKETLNCP